MSVLADPVGKSDLDDGLLIANTTDPHRGLRTFNADFIAAARSDVPFLLERLSKAEQLIEQFREAVAAPDQFHRRVNTITRLLAGY